MRLTLGDNLRRKSDGKVFTLISLGGWAGSGKGRHPLFDGAPTKLKAEDGEEVEYGNRELMRPDGIKQVRELFDKVKDRQS